MIATIVLLPVSDKLDEHEAGNYLARAAPPFQTIPASHAIAALSAKQRRRQPSVENRETAEPFSKDKRLAMAKQECGAGQLRNIPAQRRRPVISAALSPPDCVTINGESDEYGVYKYYL